MKLAFVAATLLALGAVRADAQTVAGLVRDRATGAPVASTVVGLRDAADSVIARSRTDSLGTFFLGPVGPGKYTVVFAFGARQGAASPPFTVADTAAFHQAEFAVSVPADIVYFEHEVEKPVAPANNVAPTYPAALHAKGIEGSFAAEFVVDTLGVAVPGSFVPLQPADPQFIEAVRRALPRMRFLPAERKGRKVRQLVQQAFAFSMGR